MPPRLYLAPGQRGAVRSCGPHRVTWEDPTTYAEAEDVDVLWVPGTRGLLFAAWQVVVEPWSTEGNPGIQLVDGPAYPDEGAGGVLANIANGVDAATIQTPYLTSGAPIRVVHEAATEGASDVFFALLPNPT